jgi:hypothetical protein
MANMARNSTMLAPVLVVMVGGLVSGGLVSGDLDTMLDGREIRVKL